MSVKKILIGILIVFASMAGSHQQTSQKIIHKIEEFLKGPQKDNKLLKDIMESGHVDGYFSYQEMKDIFAHLLKKYPRFVKKKVIGSSFEGEEINAFVLSDSDHQGKTELKKSKVLFTGAHHAREMLTISMVIKIYIEALYILQRGMSAGFWQYTDLIIVPVVNVDGVKYICDNYGTADWPNAKYQRKNRNSQYCP